MNLRRVLVRSAFPRLALTLLVAVAVVSCSEPDEPDDQSSVVPGSSGDPGADAGSSMIEIVYTETADYEVLAKLLAESGVFEGIAKAVTSVVVLPTVLETVFTECGEANAFYDFDGRITMCYEYFYFFGQSFLASTDDPSTVTQSVLDTGAHVYLHEIGHALVHLLEIPITGREEDSVDTLASLILLQGGSHEAVLSTAQSFAYVAWLYENQEWELPFWGEHSLAAQRKYDIACMVYGSDPENWAHLVGSEYLPEERAVRCPREYAQKSLGWDRLLRPHYRTTLEWPLLCSPFPPEGEPLINCARRDQDGEIVLHPGLLADSGEPDRIQALIVDDELLFALASGKTAPALYFDNGPDYFVEGLARSPRGGKIGFVNQDLELVVPRQWDFASPFEDGFARVCSGCSIERDEADSHGYLVGGAWGIIDRTGRTVVPVEHDLESLPAPPH